MQLKKETEENWLLIHRNWFWRDPLFALCQPKLSAPFQLCSHEQNLKSFKLENKASLGWTEKVWKSWGVVVSNSAGAFQPKADQVAETAQLPLKCQLSTDQICNVVLPLHWSQRCWKTGPFRIRYIKSQRIQILRNFSRGPAASMCSPIDRDPGCLATGWWGGGSGGLAAVMAFRLIVEG